MTVQINGSTGITTPAIDLTTPLPEIDGGTGSTGAYKMGMATAVASTSGTSINFTGIPSWAKRVTVMFNGVSTNGASFAQVQLGDIEGVEASGYSSMSSTIGGTVGTDTASTGFHIRTSSQGFHGAMVLTKLNGNLWACTSVLSGTDAGITVITAGSKTLSATLDRLRITTVNGTDTFDAGSINIMWEGV